MQLKIKLEDLYDTFCLYVDDIDFVFNINISEEDKQKIDAIMYMPEEIPFIEEGKWYLGEKALDEKEYLILDRVFNGNIKELLEFLREHRVYAYYYIDEDKKDLFSEEEYDILRYDRVFEGE